MAKTRGNIGKFLQDKEFMGKLLENSFAVANGQRPIHDINDPNAGSKPEPETAPAAPPPSAPSADDVAKTQMAQSQAAPDSQAEAEVTGKEKASRRRKAASGGKRKLSVARSTGSGLNI